MRSRTFAPAIIYMTGGLLIWAARFVAAYAFTAIACARGAADWEVLGVGFVPLGLAALTLVASAAALAVALYAIVRLRRNKGSDGDTAAGFIHQLAALLAGLGIVAMLWETIPAFTIPICA